MEPASKLVHCGTAEQSESANNLKACASQKPESWILHQSSLRAMPPVFETVAYHQHMLGYDLVK